LADSFKLLDFNVQDKGHLPVARTDYPFDEGEQAQVSLMIIRREAIQRYIEREMFKEAEEFCVKRDKQDKETSLLTVLISVYFEEYESNMEKSRAIKE